MEDEYRVFGIDYHFDGALWTFTIKAKDWNEAKERLKMIAETGRVYGSDITEIPMEGESDEPIS